MQKSFLANCLTVVLVIAFFAVAAGLVIFSVNLEKAQTQGQPMPEETGPGWLVGGLVIVIALVVFVKLESRATDRAVDRRRQAAQGMPDTLFINQIYDRQNADLILAQARRMDRAWAGRVNHDRPRVLVIDGSPSDLNRLDIDNQIAAAWLIENGGTDFPVQFTKPERPGDRFNLLKNHGINYQVRGQK